MDRQYPIVAHTLTVLSDEITPVSIYRALRDRFHEVLLLESGDYRGEENAVSYICADPIASIRLDQGMLQTSFPDFTVTRKQGVAAPDFLPELRSFLNRFPFRGAEEGRGCFGLFGYTCFSAIPAFEEIEFLNLTPEESEIPELRYSLYRYVIRFDHFHQRITLFEFVSENEGGGLVEILKLIKPATRNDYPFIPFGPEDTAAGDDEFLSLVDRCKEHIRRGDVFQIVPSRQFSRRFSGDEFQLYRALRSINPSPYLFYFDYGDYSLFGSSPEAQLTVVGRVATISPIAGTMKRERGCDAEVSAKLLADEKELAEHVMLVDLARNDLSRVCHDVEVKEFRQVQFYSHVVHLVSKVVGTLPEGIDGFELFGSCFPAGTLSGAPKYRALQLLNEYEPVARGFYGGALGFFGATGECNQAIVIRSVLRKGDRLFYQAGAGIVADSNPTSELQEVDQKLGAIRKALELATMLGAGE